MTIRGDYVYLSQSYGRRNPSELQKYRNPTANEPVDYVELNGAKIPLWTLTKSVYEGYMTMPPMSECLVTVEDAVYVLFESATEKYMDPSNPSVNPVDRLFKLTGF